MQRMFRPVAWSRNTNLYEVNIRQYSAEGNFEAFSKHLPRLKDMGVETIWFMPITPISVEVRQGTLGSYYACSDYTSINPEFGTLDDFKRLVKQAHSLGFKVIIDWVANHTGWDHVWTKTNPGFYKRNAEGKFYDTNNWHDVIDLNYYDGLMRKAMIEAMSFWVRECDIDGFRCDMAHLVPLDFWRQARQQVDQLKPLFWLAETEDIHYMEVFDCCYAWDWMHQTLKYSKGEIGLADLRALLTRYEADIPSETCRLYFTSNHDENSWNGTEYEKYGQAAKALAVFSATWDGIPLIYSGQEIPNLKRLKFFDKDLIEWKEPLMLHDFYKTLFHLRKHNSIFSRGRNSRPIRIPTHNDQYVLAYMRKSAGRELLVMLNLSPNHLFVQIPDGFLHGAFSNCFTGEKLNIIPQHSFELKAWDYCLYQK